MGYGQVNVCGTSKLQEVTFTKVSVTTSSGSESFTVSIDSGYDIKGIKNCHVSVISSGGGFTNDSIRFEGQKLIISGTKIHSFAYNLSVTYTILY